MTTGNKENRNRLQYRKKMYRRKKKLQRALLLFIMALVAGVIIFASIHVIKMIIGKGIQTVSASAISKANQKVVEDAPDYEVQLLTINEYSRPGNAIDAVNAIVVHYTANPGTTAQQNRDYFEGLKDSHETSASSHFVIGIEGEIVQCIPCNEISYASNDRNHDTLAIECCIPDDTGKFSDATYDTLIHLIAWLCGRYGLTTDDVIRHYDITGKMCPKYYVEHEDAWETLKDDVDEYIENNGIIESSEL